MFRRFRGPRRADPGALWPLKRLRGKGGWSCRGSAGAQTDKSFIITFLNIHLDY
jgi:hypothetical protein